VLWGRGDGTLTAASKFAGGTGPGYITSGDFNRDGNLDILVTCSGGNNVGVLLGNGNGVFQAPLFSADGLSPINADLADFDGDGTLDLVTADSTLCGLGGNVSVWPGKGDGTFTAPAMYSGAQSFDQVTFADFNGDNRPDIITLAGGILTMKNSGFGTFLFVANSPIAGMNVATWIANADLDLDGKLDTVVSDAGNMVFVLSGNGDGTFGAAMKFVIAGSGAPTFVTLADVNEDTLPDMVVVDRTKGEIWVLVNSSK
jgi:hypothetical protein